MINSALNNKMSWDDVSDMVAAEKAIGNPIASLIKKLDLSNGTVVLSLPNSMYSVDSDQSNNSEENETYSSPIIDVTIDLAETAFNNARLFYQERAAARKKEEKASAASEYVIKKVKDQVCFSDLKINFRKVRKFN